MSSLRKREKASLSPRAVAALISSRALTSPEGCAETAIEKSDRAVTENVSHCWCMVRPIAGLTYCSAGRWRRCSAARRMDTRKHVSRKQNVGVAGLTDLRVRLKPDTTYSARVACSGTGHRRWATTYPRLAPIDRSAIDIQVNDRRDLGCAKRRFDRLAISHHHDGQMIQIDVFLRDAHDVVGRDCRD